MSITNNLNEQLSRITAEVKEHTLQEIKQSKDQLVTAREIKIKAMETILKAYVKEHVSDQIAQHLTVLDLEVTDEQRKAIQDHVLNEVQMHLQPTHMIIENNFNEIAGTTNEIIRCLRIKCSDDPRVSCWSLLSSMTGTDISKIARNWNSPSVDEAPNPLHVDTAPSFSATQAAGTAQRMYNPGAATSTASAPTPLASNAPTTTYRSSPRTSPQFSPHMGTQNHT